MEPGTVFAYLRSVQYCLSDFRKHYHEMARSIPVGKASLLQAYQDAVTCKRHLDQLRACLRDHYKVSPPEPDPHPE